MRTLIIIALALTGSLALAGIDKSRVDEPKIPGYYDELGRKQGYFTILGKDRPELDYPLEGKVEEGSFKDDRKVGEWIVYHPDGVTPRLKGTFKDGRPNGPYEKFYPNGVMSEKGTFSDKKQLGEFETYTEEGVLQQKKVFNEDGKQDGPMVINYPDGQPQITGQYVNGKRVGEFNSYWKDGSLKERSVYDENGELISQETGVPEPVSTTKPVSASGGPSGRDGYMRGAEFKPDGYNKVYNKAEEIWMDGQFKSGKLWDGKLYKYDSDGILLKIEIWKNGAYHSDGQL